MNYQIAPMWFASFLENDKVFLTRRETLCLRVQLKRLMPLVLPLVLLTDLYLDSGNIWSYADQKSV